VDGLSLPIALSPVAAVLRRVHVAIPHLVVVNSVWDHLSLNAILKVAIRMADGVNGRHAVNHVETASELEHVIVLLLPPELIVTETQQRNVIHSLATILNRMVDGVNGVNVRCSVELLACKLELALILLPRMEGKIVWAT